MEPFDLAIWVIAGNHCSFFRTFTITICHCISGVATEDCSQLIFVLTLGLVYQFSRSSGSRHVLKSAQPAEHILPKTCHSCKFFLCECPPHHHLQMFIHRNQSIPHYKQTFEFVFDSSMNVYYQGLRNHSILLNKT